MLAANLVRSMPRSAVRIASHRANLISQHMMSTSSGSAASEPTVLFESINRMRKYTLNRPAKLNALDESMLSLLRPKIEEWSRSDLCGTIVAAGAGSAFCAGGDVAAVVKYASDPATLPHAYDYFKREFEMDYILAALNKPYVVIMDGTTFGGGVGLAANAPFRIATENTKFAMPETMIGYCPDVGASYFLSKLDGELGTYLALTGDAISGRAVFEHGFATHFIPSRRIPMLLDRLAALEEPQLSKMNSLIEELYSEREPTESPAPFIGAKRTALDYAFRHDTVEEIYNELTALKDHKDLSVSQWAKDTQGLLDLRSPTSLKVALKAIRRGKGKTLRDALDMELKIATAFCSGASPDFKEGVAARLIEKPKRQPIWSPAAISDVSEEIVNRFFLPKSPYLASAPKLSIPEHLAEVSIPSPMRFCLPSEEEICAAVLGKSGGGSLRLEELLARFADGKHGANEKVLEVVHRRCDLRDNKDGNKVWLSWKHAPVRP